MRVRISTSILVSCVRDPVNHSMGISQSRGDGDILKQPCYVSVREFSMNFCMRGIPIRYSWDVDIRDTAALNGMLEYINENPINYYRIRVKYGDSQELSGIGLIDSSAT